MSSLSTAPYVPRIQFGTDPSAPTIILEPTQLREFTIIQDLHKFLPSLRLSFADPQGDYAHVVPRDIKSTGVVQAEILDSVRSSQPLDFKPASFTFDVFRRYPANEQGLAGMADYTGLLRLRNVFSPDHSRGFSGTIKSAIGLIGAEMGITKYEIEDSLDYVPSQALIQPFVSNLEFLNWHKHHLVGDSGNGCFFCFVKHQGNAPTLVFRSYDAFANDPVKWHLIFGDQPAFASAGPHRRPVQTFEAIDNDRLLSALCTQEQRYVYFDYKNDRHVDSVVGLDAFHSMTEFFLLDADTAPVSQYVFPLGRTYGVAPHAYDLRGRVHSSYFTRLMAMSKIWVSGVGAAIDKPDGSPGLPSMITAAPGDVVSLVFPPITMSLLGSYQYAGFWLVERVIHTFTDAWRTKLLLTRNGVDTDTHPLLIKAVPNARRGGSNDTRA